MTTPATALAVILSTLLGGLAMTALDLVADPASPTSVARRPGDAMLDALRADGPHPRLGPGGRLYDGLIGSWAMEVRDPLPEGGVRVQSGECHFAWVLEGRAIQDLWIFPARAERRPAAALGPGNRYGTTIRVYDPATDGWKIDWFNPVTGAHNSLAGRRQGDEIVQSGIDADGQPMRWIFFDLTPTSFRWRAEVSTDGGETWVRDTEFTGRRIADRQ